MCIHLSFLLPFLFGIFVQRQINQLKKYFKTLYIFQNSIIVFIIGQNINTIFVQISNKFCLEFKHYKMNSPYINKNYRNHKLEQKGNQNQNFILSYESQSTLHYSHKNQNSFVTKGSNIQSISYLNNHNNSSSQIESNNFKKTANEKVFNTQQVSSKPIERRVSINTQEGQKSVQILHSKIAYLQNELQQLTKLLHQESRQSGYSQNDGYEEIAIQNAQLTIKIQQLEQQKTKLNRNIKVLQDENNNLNEEYEREHKNNNQLKQKIISYQQKINFLQQSMRQYEQKINQMQDRIKQTSKFSQQSKSSKNISIETTANQSKQTSQQQRQNKSYTATLQRQNTRLNQQIQTLLSKLHNLNIQINEQQTSKQQVMQSMNQQLIQIQKLRKQISDIEVQKLQLIETNKYLKEEINQINQINSNKNMQMQNKFIKEEMEIKFKYEEIQREVYEVRKKNQILKRENQNLIEENQKLRKGLVASSKNTDLEFSPSKNSINIIDKRESRVSQNRQLRSQQHRSSRVIQQRQSRLYQQIQQNYKSQINFLNKQLQQQRQRHTIIKQKYSQMIESQQNRIQELQKQNKKFNMQLRTLRVQMEDRRKQLEDKQREVQQKQSQIYSLRNNSSKNQWSTYSQVQRKLSMEKIKISESYYNELEMKEKQWKRRQNQYQRTKQQHLQKINNLERIKYNLQQKSKEYEANKQNLLKELQRFQSQKRRFQNQITFNKNLQIQLNIKQSQNKSLQSELNALRRQVQNRQAESSSKEYLVSELHLLQQRHQQLLRQVKHIKDRETLQNEQYRSQNSSLVQNYESQLVSFKQSIAQKQRIIQQKQAYIQSLQVKLQKNDSSRDSKKSIQNRNELYYTFNNKNPKTSQTKIVCQTCPQILKQFSIYKQLMQLKFQTMNQMLDEVKVQFTKNQIKLQQQITNDKNKYEFLIHKYNQHDSEYRILMERLWEWEKINVKNHEIKNHHQQDHSNRGSRYQNKNHIQNKDHTNRPGSHLSQVQYDLYLIKLQNSTLRSEIANLEKQLSMRGKNSQTLKQLEQLKQYNQNLLSENQSLKNHLSDVFNNKPPSSSKSIKTQSIYEKYSKAIKTSQQIQRNRHQQKALASAQLLINKLKRENDNLIQQVKFLQEQLNNQIKKRQNVIDQFQFFKKQSFANQSDKSKHVQLLDRHNLPIQYIRHHPEHKKLQSQYLTLKRAYLELQLTHKKQKQYYQQQIQKMKIQNKFHLQRIDQLQKTQKHSNFFNFNPYSDKNLQTLQSRQVNEQFLDVKQKNLMYEAKIKVLQERVVYLERQVSNRIKQCQNYTKKYELLANKLSNNSDYQISKRKRFDIKTSKQQNFIHMDQTYQKEYENIGSNVQSKHKQYKSQLQQIKNQLEQISNNNKINDIKKMIPKLSFQQVVNERSFVKKGQNHVQAQNNNQQDHQSSVNYVIDSTLKLNHNRRNALQKFKIQLNSFSAS